MKGSGTTTKPMDLESITTLTGQHMKECGSMISSMVWGQNGGPMELYTKEIT